MNSKTFLTAVLAGILLLAIYAGISVTGQPGQVDSNQSGSLAVTGEQSQNSTSGVAVNNNDGNKADEAYLSTRLDSLQESLERQTELDNELLIRIGREGLDPYTWAELNYNAEWAEFVTSLGLSDSDERSVQSIFIEQAARNRELFDLRSDKLISIEELFSALLSSADLEVKLSTVLSSEQLRLFRIYDGELTEDSRENREIITRSFAEAGYTGILAYSNLGDLEAVLGYISSGADVNKRPQDGSTGPLHNAIFHNNIEMVQALLDAGADVNWPTDTHKASPLQEAAYIGSPEVVRALVLAGADMEYHAPGREGFTALTRASASGRWDNVEELLVLGADATGKAGIQALRSAVLQGNSDMEQMLIAAGADGNNPSVVSAREAANQVNPLDF